MSTPAAMLANLTWTVIHQIQDLSFTCSGAITEHQVQDRGSADFGTRRRSVGSRWLSYFILAQTCKITAILFWANELDHLVTQAPTGHNTNMITLVF